MKDRLYKLQAAATNLNSYLYSGEAIGAKIDRDQVRELVFDLNAAYINYADYVDRVGREEVD